MDRKMSAASGQSQYLNTAPAQPPWEHNPTVRVPYYKSNTPPASGTGPFTPPALGYDPRQVRTAGHAPYFGGVGDSVPVGSLPQHDRLYQGAPMLRSQSSTTSTPTGFVRSESVSPSQSTGERSPIVVAMPGTMSARNVRVPKVPSGRTRSETRPQLQSTVPPRANSPISPSVMSRIRQGVRHMFQRSSTEEVEVERIEGRHWADEDY
ncbi:hypothetical protein K431DRAFT_281217 [Polychaeton citri CBS 116435]|uniref:Uncharacterized protein n=1 Tax=Polychaeton citri CBS 116435 TaxID=1314669 RepID=A0A9P4UU25_9PEZI|nr:hypothetical protein K431DRAFT_281217 [Polychaeton citri CBS 116435]